MKLNINAPGHALYAPMPEAKAEEKQMTVAELRAILSGLPDDTLVSHIYEAGCCSGPIMGAFVDNGELILDDGYGPGDKP